MIDDRQERIRQRAYAIWENEGRPEGSHRQHWDQASAEIDLEDSRRGQQPREAAAGATSPATSGAPLQAETPLHDPFAKRRSNSPRQAGPTPRANDKPVAGS
jgi:hypothetical protein